MEAARQRPAIGRPDWRQAALLALALLGFWSIATGTAVYFLAGADRPPGGDAEDHLARAIEEGQVFLREIQAGRYASAIYLFGGVEPQYPGLVYATLNVAFAALGTSYRTVALHNSAWLALFLAGMFLLARRFLRAPGAAFSAALASLLPFIAGGCRSICLDFFSACAYPWVILAFLRTDGFAARGPSYGAGIVAGLSFLTRAHSSFLFWPLPLFVAMRSRRTGRSWGTILEGLLRCALGFLLAVHPYLMRFTVFRTPWDRSPIQVVYDLILSVYGNPAHPWASYYLSPLSWETPAFLLGGLAAGLNPVVTALVLASVLLFAARPGPRPGEKRLLAVLLLANLFTYGVLAFKVVPYYAGMAGPCALLTGCLVWEIGRRALRIAIAGGILAGCLAWNLLGTFLPDDSLRRLPLDPRVDWTYFLPGEKAYRFSDPDQAQLASIVRDLRDRLPRGECTYTFIELQDAQDAEVSHAYPLMQLLNASERMDGGLATACRQARRFVWRGRPFTRMGGVHERIRKHPLLDEPMIIVARDTKMRWDGETVTRELSKRFDLALRLSMWSREGRALLDVGVWRSKALGEPAPDNGGSPSS